MALFGLPSLHSIIEAIANDFFGALAGALVPSWLKHGTVATIQHLVALPDPASWGHVSRLQGEMTYLGAMLLPVTLAVGATRYWLVGLTGAAHPASAVVRCAASSGVLVAYRWVVEQTVAAVNTLTHGILGLPAVSGGLSRIIGVLFGGALLSGGGGVFGAFLVIVGVVFAAGLFAMQVLLTVALAVLVVAGPPLIVLAAIPELSHLARGWADALLAVALVPLGWTVLFATAGALCLDATSFTGAAGGLPGHVAAAFAGLITFVLAVRLPLMAVGEIRSVFSRHGLRGATGSPQASAGSLPGGERVRAAQARLRAVGVQAVPTLGASVGRAAGALGAPAGGPIGAARRRILAVARAHGVPAGASRTAASAGGAPARSQEGKGRGVRERLARARGIMAAAPAEAATAMSTGRRRARNVAGPPAASNSGSARSRREGGAPNIKRAPDTRKQIIRSRRIGVRATTGGRAPVGRGQGTGRAWASLGRRHRWWAAHRRAQRKCDRRTDRLGPASPTPPTGDAPCGEAQGHDTPRSRREHATEPHRHAGARAGGGASETASREGAADARARAAREDTRYPAGHAKSDAAQPARGQTQAAATGPAMIHRTFRSLDDPPKLVGFTIRQWGALIAASAVVLATVRLAHLPGKPAITLATFAVGLPAALTYVSESGGLHLGRLLADVVRWRLARKTLCAFDAEHAERRARAPRGAERLLGVAAIAPDGLLIRNDGTYVRYLQSEVVNPLVARPRRGSRDLSRVRADRRAPRRPPDAAAVRAGHAAAARGAPRRAEPPLRAGRRAPHTTPASTSEQTRSVGSEQHKKTPSAPAPRRSSPCRSATCSRARSHPQAGGEDGRRPHAGPCASAPARMNGQCATRCATAKASAQTCRRWACTPSRSTVPASSTCCTRALTRASSEADGARELHAPRRDQDPEAPARTASTRGRAPAHWRARSAPHRSTCASPTICGSASRSSRCCTSRSHRSRHGSAGCCT